MTLDWSKEIETTEDPPRPVRVLFDPRGVASAADMDGQLWWVTVDGDAIYRVGGGQINLRNVAPPKPVPVLLEAWVVWTNDGRIDIAYSREASAKERVKSWGGVYARAAAMSNGSPVPASPEQFDQMREMAKLIQDRDEWRTKVEALQAEAALAEHKRLLALALADERECYANLEIAEADLSAAQAALRDYSKGDLVYYAEHASAIAAARADCSGTGKKEKK